MFAFLFFLFFSIFFFVNGIVCPQGWTYFGEKCWFKSIHESTWIEADSECHDRYGASLATIQNEKEVSFISKLSTFDVDDVKFFDEGVTANKNVLDCFTKIENVALLGSSVMSPSNIKSPEACMEECAKSEDRYDQKCKSILWYKESKECVLNDKTKNDTDAIFVEDPEVSKNIDYYEKFCDFQSDEDEGNEILPSGNKSPSGTAPKVKGPKRKGEITGIRSCFTKFKHSSLVGFVDKIHDNVTERECLTKCWKCEDCLGKGNELCKSVTYYPSVKQCILAKESRRNHVDYFDQNEPLSVFLERRHDCLFEMCEDLEIDLIFAIDGSTKMKFEGFNRSLHLINEIVTGIHEITEFWKITVIQVGTEGPAVVEIDQKSFDTLDDFRRNLATIGWRRSPGSRLGNSLVDVADLAMRYALKGESDFVWMISMTTGFSDDKLDDFEILKNSKTFTSFAIGIGSDLEYVNLQKIATSTSHLIHSQETKEIVKDISSKLCPKSETLQKISPPSSIPPNDAAVASNPKSIKNIEKISGDKDAYRNAPWLLHDDEEIALNFKKAKNGGVKTHQLIHSSTIAFMGQPKAKKIDAFKNSKLSNVEIHSIAEKFWKSSRNDSIFELNDADEEDVISEDSLWIGLKRGDLGKMEWSDGSRLNDFEEALTKHLDIELDRGDCIKQGIDTAWSQENCNKKLQFICSLRPLMTINEKISKDFERLSFNNQKAAFSNELTEFDGTPENGFVPESSENDSENLKAAPTLIKENENEIKSTTEMPKTDSMDITVKPLIKDLFMQPNMSNFLIPFGGRGQ